MLFFKKILLTASVHRSLGQVTSACNAVNGLRHLRIVSSNQHTISRDSSVRCRDHIEAQLLCDEVAIVGQLCSCCFEAWLRHRKVFKSFEHSAGDWKVCGCELVIEINSPLNLVSLKTCHSVINHVTRERKNWIQQTPLK